ncbi:hypothetical protein O3Q52_38045 [Streptomyces sp. ActVer]|uniref:hypothetical protein n=1 Tax=Streptomyces sp. ActVer TaxID=3014558 RepID=UPI0022B2F066|nr:hypothetical protein [Streptomyces sp. ActVer]MCZ4513841.1 hypothetical protein [Streptomyces sp. ActVer]
MPKDVYAAIGALVRTEVARTHTQPPHPSTEDAAAREEIVAPKSPPEPVRRRLRSRATAALRRLAAVSG